MRPPDPAPARGPQSGFTLLEVLVAFVIVALALGVLFGGGVSGLRATLVADRTLEAVSRARSHLASIGHGVALHPTRQQGDDGSLYRWSLAIAPAARSPDRSGGSLTLYRVTVTESWDEPEAGTRRVVLSTERLAGQQAASAP